jgi:LPS-assembly lipoprotein
MSSLNLRGLTHIAVVAGLSLGLSACFRPLHGPTASGVTMQATLAAIDVPEIQWPPDQANMGHYLRSELIYALNGSGSNTPKRYILRLQLAKSLSTPIVDSETGRASSATLTGRLTYTLTNATDQQVVTQGTATSNATYDRFPQRFATVRAGRDAEIRLAKVLADQVRTRLAAALSARS